MKLTTPFDTPAAGLVALGAVVRRLETPDAHDVGSHYHRLVSLARNTKRAVFFRHRAWRTKGRWVSVVERDGTIRLLPYNGDSSESWRLLETNAHQWMRDGDPPVEAYDAGDVLPFTGMFRQLSPVGGVPLTDNLRRGDSAIVLAGRATGMAGTRKVMEGLSFRNDVHTATLAELLSIHDWSRSYVSRARYLNSRTVATGAGRHASRMDRPAAAPRLVIADGAAALQCTLNDGECEHADVIAVIPRTLDRDQLDATAADVSARCHNWYQPTTDVLKGYPRLPSGVGVYALASVQV